MADPDADSARILPKSSSGEIPAAIQLESTKIARHICHKCPPVKILPFGGHRTWVRRS